MPYTTCPQCGVATHVQVSDPASWYARHGVKEGVDPRKMCLDCRIDLDEHDIVTVLRSHPQAGIKAGDQGVVVAVLKSLAGEVAYEVECVEEDGRSRWLTTLPRQDLTRRYLAPDA